MKSALEAVGNLGWNNAGDGDGIKETLLNVDALVGTTIVDEVGNSVPVAAFTSSCTDLICSFTDRSTDGDGTITSRQWAFGDSSTSASASPDHAYATAGTYLVTLTVTDDDGASDTASTTLTVSAPPAGGFTLDAVGYKVKGRQKSDLTWGGATTAVDIYRDGVKEISNSPNDGRETDHIDAKGSGSYTYQACETGTGICSNQVTVSF